MSDPSVSEKPSGDAGLDRDLIGRSKQPILALTFAGGGYSTALQVGVIHALLVSRGRAPDVVVGISAGAINAALLAEVLQASGPPQGKTVAAKEGLFYQVARFREVFQTLKETPGNLLAAMLPDSLQIDTNRPLEPLKLPIHARDERKARDHALHARSGLMNLLNKILELRLPIGFITRLVRRVLGLKALPEVRSKPRLMVMAVGEVLRLVELTGTNLHRLAPLLAILAVPSLTQRLAAPEGASAGELISRSVVWKGVVRFLGFSFCLTLLVAAWVVLAPLALLGFVVIVATCGIPLAAEKFKQRFATPSGDEGKPPRVGARPLAQTAWSFTLLISNLLVTWCIWVTALWLAIVLSLIVFGLAPPLYPWTSILIPFWSGEFATLAGWIAVFLSGLGLLLLANIVVRYRHLIDNILRRNSINQGILDPHPLRNLLVRIFDHDYYGRFNMKRVVEHALEDRQWARRDPHDSKKLSHYGSGSPPIRIGVAAINVASGELETLQESESVVDALLAATAIVPFFPPHRTGKSGPLFVDGTFVVNEPTWPLMQFLRDRIPKDPTHAAPGDLNVKASAVHLYSVSPLPFSRSELGPEPARKQARPGGHWPLVDVATRALELQRFRDATLERRLTELRTRVMPSDQPVIASAEAEPPGGARDLKTWVYPIEPDAPANVSRQLFEAQTEDDRQRVIAETVADGCRASLEAMIPTAIRSQIADRQHGGLVRCRRAVAAHLGRRADEIGLPGSDPVRGPGLSEVCRHCAVKRHPGVEKPKEGRCRLVSRPSVPSEFKKAEGDWPTVDADNNSGKPLRGDGAAEVEPATDSPVSEKTEEALKREAAQRLREGLKNEQHVWPHERDDLEETHWELRPRKDGRATIDKPATGRPTVSLLFSGGVFRGVFQVGVANALSEIGLRPDIVAGASVGSITAAMVARLFAGPRGGPCPNRNQRADELRRLAATYMAIDRLVLTDRFSDFVRRITVRASQTTFSLHQADRVVRQYDRAAGGRYSKEARVVMAGLERLFYLSPFEFTKLIRALRLRRTDRVVRQLRSSFQELLERGGVGDEVLGTEPLKILIAQHILGTEGGGMNLEAEFDDFLHQGIYFLATATNLTRGRLEILGEQQVSEATRRVSLSQGLLASSAFPGIFRPRKGWEVMPRSGSQDLLTDGGVMDNLPLDAVAQFLLQASRAALIERRPRLKLEDGEWRPVPHLLFSASLEVDPRRSLSELELEKLEQDWTSLRRRTGRLGYNQKLRLYADSQRALRRIWGKRDDAGDEESVSAFRPLDLEIFTIRPRWLCGTYAFHPMLGFRRRQSAQSIAHGCALTLLDIGRQCEDSTRRANFKAWGVKLDRLPGNGGDGCGDVFERAFKQPETEGNCWYRPGIPCPFSQPAPQKSRSGDATAEAIHVIYEECGKPATHRGKD